MAAVGGFHLFPEIIQLSVAGNWSQAVKEWKLVDIEMLDRGEFDQCLCGHWPIRELCHIVNTQNGNKTTVGNHCIEKFNKQGNAEGAAFSSVPKMIRACKKIMKDSTASVNRELVKYAYRAHVFTRDNARFYASIIEKRNLTRKQLEYKKSLNHKLLFQVVLSVRACYHRLKANPLRETAGPRLVDVAFQKGVITDRDQDFYHRVWDRANSKLSSGQVSYRQGLNDKILAGLKDVYENARPRRVGVAAAADLMDYSINEHDD